MKKYQFKNIVKCCVLGLASLLCSTSVRATGLMNSSLYTGTAQLLADIMMIVTILCPTVCGVAAVIFAIRRGMADEQDGKMWTRRMTNAIAFGVLGGLVSGIITMIASYYAG